MEYLCVLCQLRIHEGMEFIFGFTSLFKLLWAYTADLHTAHAHSLALTCTLVLLMFPRNRNVVTICALISLFPCYGLADKIGSQKIRPRRIRFLESWIINLQFGVGVL